MELPRFFVVGMRPVKFVSTPEGGMDVLALDWKSGEFVRDLSYLTRCLEGAGEVDEVSEEAFLEHLAEIKKGMG